MAKQNTMTNLETINLKDLQLEPVAKAPRFGFAVYIRALMQNWRQGTVGCKTRSEVAFSNRKPWKQKGTGRARVGSIRSPLWRKGGIIFGPQPRTRTLKINKHVKNDVLHALFTQFAENNGIFTLDWQVQNNTPSTKAFFAALTSAQLQDKKIALFVDRDDVMTWASTRNIKNVRVLSFDDVNAYDLAQVDCLVVLKKDITNFKEMVAQWN